MRDAPRCSLLLAVALAGACAGGEATSSSSSPAPARPAPEAVDGAEVGAPGVLADLCGAQDGAGDPAAARTAFARAHGPLHDLAQEVESRDRQTVARLLEDKQQVESALDRSPEPDELATALADLVESTRHALQAIGSPAPSCG